MVISIRRTKTLVKCDTTSNSILLQLLWPWHSTCKQQEVTMHNSLTVLSKNLGSSTVRGSWWLVKRVNIKVRHPGESTTVNWHTVQPAKQSYPAVSFSLNFVHFSVPNSLFCFFPPVENMCDFPQRKTSNGRMDGFQPAKQRYPSVSSFLHCS